MDTQLQLVHSLLQYAGQKRKRDEEPTYTPTYTPTEFGFKFEDRFNAYLRTNDDVDNMFWGRYFEADDAEKLDKKVKFLSDTLKSLSESSTSEAREELFESLVTEYHEIIEGLSFDGRSPEFKLYQWLKSEMIDAMSLSNKYDFIEDEDGEGRDTGNAFLHFGYFKLKAPPKPKKSRGRR